MRTTTEMKIGMTFPAEIALFDTETTDVETDEARIVTAFIGILDTATLEIKESWEWVINPGVPVPDEAARIHGYTTERLLVEGGDPKQAIFEITQRLDIISKQSIAIVAMNAVFDFTVLDRETERHWPGMRPLIEGVWQVKGGGIREWEKTDDPWGFDTRGGLYELRWRVINSPVIFDPMVYDRAIDKYRAGKRTLVDLCRVYGVPVLENAHDAKADCIMAGGVAVKLLQHSRIQEMSLSEVHAKLIPTKRNQAIDLARYWQDKKLPKLTSSQERADLRADITDVLARGHYWPIIPRDWRNNA